MTRESSHDVDLTLRQADESRRGFLGKLLTGGAAAAAIPAMSSLALAQGGAGKGRGKGGGQKGKGGRPDPAQLAAMLIKQHDRDGDGALNLRELTAALQAMRERRSGGRKGKGGQGGAGGKGGPR